MSPLSSATAHVAGNAPATEDLGPLAWVLGEIQKSIDRVGKSLHRIAREPGTAPELDAVPLRLARQQLHQAVGALQMVGHAAPALVLGAVEFAVQSFVAEPSRCNEAAVQKIDKAGFAVTDFLSAMLSGKTVSSVALFPQYRDVLELVGNERVHPADLWSRPFRWVDIAASDRQPALVYDPAVRSKLDREVLRVVQTGDDAAARRLSALCLGLARGAVITRLRSFWTLAAAFFESLALSLMPADVYVKRAASRVLLQYATLARGDNTVSDRLGEDLLFFCAQAAPGVRDEALTLRAVRAAWAVEAEQHVDYTVEQFGRFDPLVLTQARKRLEAAKEMWSALSAGDLTRMRQVVDTFAQLGESLAKLHPPSAPMVQALNNAVEDSLRAGRPPATVLAMEVATSVLYLEAAFEDLDPHDRQLTARTVQLAGRIDRAREGGRSEPLEPWMEELYRRVSDRQTMGTVVDELRSHLSEFEKSLDQFFRRPGDKSSLRTVPSQLLQMRGVFSVLGLDQAAQTVQRMRDDVENLMARDSSTEESTADETRTFDSLGNNLGALGFLIDMLGYQPALAKRLFVFDLATGELKPLMGRQGTDTAPEAPASVSIAPAVAPVPPVSPVSAPITAKSAKAVNDAGLSVEEVDAQIAAKLAALAAPTRKKASPLEEFSRASDSWRSKITGPAPLEHSMPDTEVTELEEEDLLNIFLDEAREVLHNGLAAVSALRRDAAEGGELTVLRRAFHTLKGSSRMVGLMDFGEAAWAFEQVLNTWLADQREATPELIEGTGTALQDFARWVEAVASGEPHNWQAVPFRTQAEALRSGEPITPMLARAADADALAIAARQIAAEAPSASAVPMSPTTEAVARTMPSEPEVQMPELPDLDFLATAYDAPPEFDASKPEAGKDTEESAPKPRFGHSDDDFAATDFLDFDAKPTQIDPAFQRHPERVADPAFPLGNDEIDFFATAQSPLETGFETTAFSAPREFGKPSTPHVERGVEPVFSPPLFAPSADALLPPAAKVAAPESLSESVLPPVEPTAVELTPVSIYVTVPGIDSATVSSADDAVKAIGPLRIGIALYNVYLNEADEWSRQLADQVGEWAMEPHTQVADSTIGLAHSLAGSSATVGFQSLSGMARLFEAALQHLHMQGSGTQAQGAVLVAAAEELRRLLHQFAAGFLKEPADETVKALREVAESPMPAEPAEAKADYADPSDRLNHVDRPAGFSASTNADPVARVSDVTMEDSEDAIDLADAVDVDLFPIFEEEAAELLPQLGTALREWAQRPEDAAPRASVLRTLHTLKGSARLAGAMRLGERAHRMESEIEYVGSAGADTESVERLLGRFDGLQASFDALRADDAATQVEIARMAAAAAAVPLVSVPEPVLKSADEPVSALSADTTSVAVSAAESDDAAEIPTVTPAKAALPTPSALVPLRAASTQQVRIRTQLLDRLVAQAGEVIITRSRLEAELGQLRSSLDDLTGNLDRLRQQLRDIEVQAESQMQSRLAQAKDSQQGFDPLEFDRFTRVQELTRMMAESVNDVATVQRTLQKTVQATEDDLSAQARQTRELQRGLLRTRMVEFEGLSDRLYRVVRQASKDTGKQVRLDITGGTIEMDRGVLERMTPAFEHLLRNCVAHGIEDAAVREKAGKDASGLIVIDLQHEGNDVSVTFKDDGAGLDHERITARARALGLIEDGVELSPVEASEMIFKPGFSTADQVSELAGRGIGMDVVRADVAALGGRIETRSTAGVGTSFKLVLPLTTAVTHVVMMRAGTVSIGVPSSLVELVQRVGGSDVESAYLAQRYPFGSEQVPFYWAGALLQSSARSERAPGKHNTIVVVRSAAQRVALHVDEVLGNQEVVVKNLGPQLSRLPGMAGISVLASGAVALLYNPVALAAVHGELARELQAAGGPATGPGGGAIVSHARAADGSTRQSVMLPQAPAQVPLVLVVDDSITVRRVTQRLLQREGYRVALAADGLQALERLQQERPSVVLSDIEMPRMDGFDLARNIRADASLADLPIIMITSRIAEKHRDHARTLGVNHYLGKPYSEDELLRLVRSYTNAPALAPSA